MEKVTMESPESSRESSRRGRRCLLGPLSYLLAFCGFDLSFSIFTKPPSKPVPRSLLHTAIAAVILGLFIFRLVTIAQITVEPLSYAWGESNLLTFVTLHGLVSALCLGSWTASGFFGTFYDALSTSLPTNIFPVDREVNSKKRYITIFIMGGLYLLVSLSASTKSAIQGPNSINGTSNSSWVLSAENQFGVEPLLCAWLSLCSVLALSSFYLLHAVLAAEIEHLNAEMTDAAAAGTLQDWLPAGNERHRSLLSLLALLSTRTATFASFSALSSLISNINALFIFLSFKDDMSAFSKIVAIAWMIATSGLMMQTLLPPGNIQTAVHNTAEILVLNKRHNELSPEAMQQTLWMIERQAQTRTRILLMNAFYVSSTTGHAIMFMVPNLATAMMICRRFI